MTAPTAYKTSTLVVFLSDLNFLTVGHGYQGCSVAFESFIVGLIGTKVCQLQQELLPSSFLSQAPVLTCLPCGLDILYCRKIQQTQLVLLARNQLRDKQLMG